ncbi:MAG: hypothetical protein JWN70_2058 [Planctomycetaceae bacterium]|nr:hypothetical protein [Planctomycetaceae bacterium]
MVGDMAEVTGAATVGVTEADTAGVTVVVTEAGIEADSVADAGTAMAAGTVDMATGTAMAGVMAATIVPGSPSGDSVTAGSV